VSRARGRRRRPWARRVRAALAAAALGAAPLALALALIPPEAVAQPGRGARDATQRLRALDQRNRLEDLQTRTQRQREADRLRGTGDPSAVERARRRWHTEDRQIDLRRAREREAIERGADARTRIERSVEPLPGPPARPSLDAEAERRALERERADIERRERLDRLRRETWRPRPGPGVQRWPR